VKPTIIIAAISSRVYVQAAIQAGFEVIAIDAFCDVDTQASCKQAFQIKIENGQFNAALLLAVLDKIDLSNCLGLSYGAGFEAQADLLTAICKRIKLIGNAPETVEKVKNPQTFFDFCMAQNMLHPATQFERPSNSKNWLQKRIGGSGGVHIRPVLPLDLPPNHQIYYQKIQAGTPISCLFLSDDKNMQVIGFNEQLCNSTALLPYRYGGAVSHFPLSDKVKNTIETFVQSAAQFYQLRGLNSADFIVDGDAVYALEMNPRLSATVDLYRADLYKRHGDLFAAHVAACLGRLETWPVVDAQSRAHFVVYAYESVSVPAQMDWPDWVRDIPQPNSEIPADGPICTVVADARTAKRAKQKLFERVRDL
jgi:uncharacterized protein